jgi:hypothetical protein
VTAAAETSADWCAVSGDLAVCGTRMIEHSRRSLGVKWCFQCRTRSEFEWIVMVPDGFSYYGPAVNIKCANCGASDGDLFPGYSREFGEDE